MKRNLKCFGGNGRRTHCNLQIKHAATNQVRINYRSRGPQHTAVQPHSATKIQNVLRRKGEEELTGNHGARQVGSTKPAPAARTGRRWETKRTVQTGPRKASRSQKGSKKEAPLEVEPTAIGQCWMPEETEIRSSTRADLKNLPHHPCRRRSRSQSQALLARGVPSATQYSLSADTPLNIRVSPMDSYLALSIFSIF